MQAESEGEGDSGLAEPEEGGGVAVFGGPGGGDADGGGDDGVEGGLLVGGKVDPERGDEFDGDAG